MGRVHKGALEGSLAITRLSELQLWQSEIRDADQRAFTAMDSDRSEDERSTRA